LQSIGEKCEFLRLFHAVISFFATDNLIFA